MPAVTDQRRRQLPFGLRVDVVLRDGVVLVAPQVAQVAVVVDEALAPLVLPVGVGAERHGERPAERARRARRSARRSRRSRDRDR